MDCGMCVMNCGLWAMDYRQIGARLPTGDMFLSYTPFRAHRAASLTGVEGGAVSGLWHLLVQKVRISGAVPPFPYAFMERTRPLTLTLSADTQHGTKIALVISDLSQDLNPVAVVHMVTRSFTEMNELWGMLLVVCTHSMGWFLEADSYSGSQVIFLCGT
jgi:hypothetical protein